MSGLVRSQEDFSVVRDIARRAFDIEMRLPANPFRQSEFVWAGFESEVAAGGEFWTIVSYLACMMNDTSLIVMTLDPDPIGYFFHHFGTFGAAYIDPMSSIQEYWDIVTQDPGCSPADSIESRGDVVILCGPRGKWGVWNDRHIGLGFVFCSQKETLEMVLGHTGTRSLEWNLIELIVRENSSDAEAYSERLQRSLPLTRCVLASGSRD
jgi:hypothetical protein